jgi:4-amino-4-deoxy-L-arabinose transferase-like glycosyltransferase
MKNFFKNNWVLLLILLLALFFRYWQINHYPAGLFPDEAANGLDINSMFHGQIQPFYPRGNGREAGFFYFEALSVLIFGRGVWQFHIVSAAFGFGSVIAIYFLAKEMYSKRIALLASFFIAVSSYATAVTRTAFRATTVPLVSTLVILFLVKFFNASEHRQKVKYAVLSGLFFGLGFYTYTAYRMMLPLVVGFLFLIFYGFRSQWRQIFDQYKKYKIIFVVVFLLTIAWITAYYIKHPHDFVGRAGQVSIFSKDLNHGDVIGTFITVLKKTALSFFTAGDYNYRQNVSGFPFLSPFISPFFAGALILFTIAFFKFLKQVCEQKIETKTAYNALIAIWFYFMLVPEISTAEGIPHGLRIIGVIPPMFILAAYGVDWFWKKLPHQPFIKFEKWILAFVFISAILVYNFALYFGVALGSEDNYEAFRGDLTVVSDYLNQRNSKAHTYLSLDSYWLQTTDYLTTDKNQPYQTVDPAYTYTLNLQKGDQVVFTQTTLFDREKFMKYHSQAKMVKIGFNQFGNIIMYVYEQE